MEEATRKNVARFSSSLITYILLSQSVFLSNVIYFSKIIKQHNYWYVLYVILHLFLVVMSLWTHYMCMTTNPGFIPEIKDLDVVEVDMIFTHCKKCDSYRPIGSHHCKTCNRCILRMDHHCVWVCNCVGKFNQKFFMQYLSYIIVMSFFDLLLILINVRDFLSYSVKNNKYQMYYIIKRAPYLIVIYGCIALIFFLFCVIMLIDQLVTVFRNRTGIDSLQKIKFQRLKFRESLRNTFGNTCSEVLLPIKNEKDKYWGKELTLMDIVAIMSLDEFKLEEGYQLREKI